MVQGRGIDSSLNDLGRKQAESFYKAYSDILFDKIYTSSLRRTKESVQGFIDDGLPYESLEGLDEISWGDYEGQFFDPEMHQRYLDSIEEWKAGKLDTAISGGESPNQVMERQKKSIDYILSNEDEETILICCHGRAIRILVCWLLNHPLEKMDRFLHQNLCLYELSYSNNAFSLVRENDTKHLEGL